MNCMEFKAEKDGWILSFDDGFVQLIQIDFRLGLLLSDGSGKAQIHIETPCLLKVADSEILLTPSKASSLGPILSLFNSRIINVMVNNTGCLMVRFGDGQILEVPPDKSYESWQINMPSIGSMMVCSPGGKVSLF